jgi:multiple sugar transport system permease protein
LFLRSWDKFTLPIAIAILPGLGKYTMPETLALIILSIVPIMLIFLFGQRYVIKGIALTGLKG